MLVGLLPLAMLAFATLFRSGETHRRDLIETSLAMMSSAMSAVDSELMASMSALDALAASPRLAREDFEGFHGEALQLLARRPTWLNVIVADTQARQLVNTYLPLGSPLPSGMYAEAIAGAVRERGPSVGDIGYSPVLETYVFSVRVPIMRDGIVKYVLIANMRPDAIQSILLAQRIGEEGVAAVVDRQYNVVARTRSQDDLIGRPASTTFLELLAAGETSGWSITNTLEGVPVYTIYYRSELTGWAAGLGIPTRTLDGPVLTSFAILGGLILGCVLLGVFAALRISRAITTPMRELEAAAEELGEGRAPGAPQTNIPEIRRIAAALSAAHEELDAVLTSERLARSREREARLLAEEASRMKDEFLAMLGHELRNPLAAVGSASQVLERAVDDSSPAARKIVSDAAAIIGRQTRHLARLTDDLLDTARLVMGRIALECKPADLAEIVQNTVDLFASAQRLAQHRVRLMLTPVWVKADPTRMDQVVANVLTNALKYTPPGGTIDVRLEREGRDAVLRVRDSGIGIEPALLPRIFELFVQGERSIDRSLGGLGIGLTLVRRLTELHGGKVTARSDGPGAGSELEIRLPALETAAGELRVVAPTPVPPRRIVLVEDNDDVRAGVKRLLELDGHEVFEASDGRAGVDTILRVRAEFAVIDIGLPALDGLDVARAVRAALGQSITLVAMTGYGNAADLRKGFDAGFDHYLVKPVDPAALRAVLAQAVNAAKRPNTAA